LDRINVPGAALAIVEGGEVVRQRGFGRVAPGGGVPTPGTPFLICSLTKSFTAMAVMQLVEAGKIDLDSPVQRYLPWFRVADTRASARITVHHLLNQTSGRSFGTYIREQIFEPLDMRNSFASRNVALLSGLAVGHRSWFGFPVAAPDLPIPVGSFPSGQLMSSVEDMSHYMIANPNQGRYGEIQVLSAEGIAELHRPAVDATTMGVEMGEYGMGWFVQKTKHGIRIWHHGTAPDFSAYLALLPETNRGIVLLVNANQMMLNYALLEAGESAASLLAGGQPIATVWGMMPWILRGLLLIPLLQIVGAFATVRRIRRWRRDARGGPYRAPKWLFYILLPSIPNLILLTFASLRCEKASAAGMIGLCEMEPKAHTETDVPKVSP
jgi:CubicO group peptidase (beta-lactamase class C family)